MNTDWKALCVELAKVLAEEYGVQREFANGDPLLGSGAIELLSRVRIALSQPEPEGLTDEEIDALERRHWQLTGVVNESLQQEELFDYRAFLREGLARWGRPAVEPETNGQT